MLSRDLIEKAKKMLRAPLQRDDAADRRVFGHVVAASQRLEGIETSVEEVLEAADRHPVKAHQ